MADVLGLDPSTLATDGWLPFALFDDDARRCVANVEAALLPLILGGSIVGAAGIRSVAVAARWRGRGLFRALMEAALDWCDASAARLTFLYTAEPALYDRFGFRQLTQHAFVGPPPPSRPATPARQLDISDPRDRESIVRFLETRAPLSRQATLGVPTPMVLANLAKDVPALASIEDPPALIVYEEDSDTIVFSDIAASAAPDIAGVLGALGRAPQRVKTLFPPDRLGWYGEPVAEDTGLMVRGTVPEAMTRPFMFPPTAEF